MKILLLNIVSIISILVLSIVLIIRIKLIDKYSLYEKIIIGICISDLIYEVLKLICST
jgi:hypothetical protein